MSDIHKAAGIIVVDRKLLVERSRGKDFFIAPGGKIEPGETAEQALVRELREEFQIDVHEADLTPFGAYSAAAANHPGQQVHMQVFIVTKWQGDIVPDSEVEEIFWLTSTIPAGMQVGSIFAHDVLPRLHQQGIVD